MLDAEGVGTQDRCAGSPEQTFTRRYYSLEVFQANCEKCPAATLPATLSVCQQTMSILKMMELDLEHTCSPDLSEY